MGVPETVTELLEPVLATLGVELFDVEWAGSTLRIIIDADEGVTTDQLTKVNRMASPILDQHDPIPGRYTLEVSSPGVERNLTRLDHFNKAIGEQVVVKLNPGTDPRRVKGTLLEADAARLVIDVVEVDGNPLKAIERHELQQADVAKARTVFEWGPKPKPGGKQNQKGKQAKKSGPSDPVAQKKNDPGESKKSPKKSQSHTTNEPKREAS